MSNIKEAKKIYLVGIKGVGMTALCCALKDIKIDVSGSDIKEDFITKKILDKLNIKIDIGFEEGRITKNFDTVIYSAGHNGEENPQVIKANELGIPTYSYAKALAELFSDKKVIAVSGTHGKTTTSAMLATILSSAKLDPSWIIGTSEIPTLLLPGKSGKGEYAVIEADEYLDKKNGKAKFLYLNPYAAIITSLEWDHPDVFKNQSQYTNAFRKLVRRIYPKGILVVNGESPQLKKISKSFKGKLKFVYSGKSWNNLKLKFAGNYNLFNATFASRMAHELDISQKNIISSLANFSGLKRRLELVFSSDNLKVYDDYAHHPTEIKTVLSGLRNMYARANIIAIFQPHTLSRTEQFLTDFSKSFNNADSLLVTPIFTSARENEVGNLDTEKRLISNHKNSAVVKDKVTLNSALIKLIKKDSFNIIATLGAGDIYNWVKFDELNKN